MRKRKVPVPGSCAPASAAMTAVVPAGTCTTASYVTRTPGLSMQGTQLRAWIDWLWVNRNGCLPDVVWRGSGPWRPPGRGAGRGRSARRVREGEWRAAADLFLLEPDREVEAHVAGTDLGRFGQAVRIGGGGQGGNQEQGHRTHADDLIPGG